MPRGTTQRRPVTVAALLDAALELFAEQGFGATSIPDICSRAGLTKGAFYSNFCDKEALFLALFDRENNARVARMRAAASRDGGADGAAQRGSTEDGGPATAEVEAGAPLFGGTTEDERRWFLISTEFTLHAIRHPRVAAQLAEHEAATRAAMADLLVSWMEARGIVPTVPIGDLVGLLVAMTEGTQSQTLTRHAARGTTPRRTPSAGIVALLQHFTRPADNTTGGPA